MNDIFDKLLIRILFTIFICIALFLYKYAHVLFYPSGKKQILKRIYPIENAADSIHLFSRLIGVALIFSILEFNEYSGILISLFHFLTWSVVGFSLYLLSIYIMESIIFYNFEYKDEILKKKNMSYAIISFTTSICLAFIVRTIFKESESSLVIAVILWLFALVLFGFATKFYHKVSKMNFNSLMIQKNIGLSLSYSGFLLGATVIITCTFSHEHHSIMTYITQTVLKTLLGALILPLFMIGIKSVFKLEDEFKHTPDEDKSHIGFGIYEGAVFLTGALLTSIIIGQIHFGTIYPFF